VLSHLVHPIPHNLIDYVWDYGALPLDTEKAYIRGMVRSRAEFSNPKIVHLFVECVSLGQQSVRTLEGGDSSSVSLRDLQRTIKFFGFFIKFLSERKRPNLELFEKEGVFSYWRHEKNPLSDKDEVLIRAVVLTISVCYLFRLCSKASRNILLSKCSEHLTTIMRKKHLTKEYIEQVIDDEQHDIIYRIKAKNLLGPDIAVNVALKENIFTILVCLLNRVPLIICGKPGSSKTQAFKILKETLKGVSSEETLFSELPEINELYYQGTLHSTSKGIKKLFERAKQNAKDNEFNNILTVFFFDEIGLAEISPNNPLKVLHDLLEEEDLQVAFLGISNWTLDASKMNRAVYLARWDLDREDLIEISSHYRAKLDLEAFQKNVRNLLECSPQILADCYLMLRKFQENSFKHKNFHGSRDFYALVKFVFREVDQGIDFGQVGRVIRKGLDRNFSGGFAQDGTPSEVLIKQFFIESIQKHLNVDKNDNKILEVKDNDFEHVSDKELYFKSKHFLDIPNKINQILASLNDPESRFLLVFVDSNYVERILLEKIQQKKEKVSFLQGSNFTFDLHNQSLSADLLKEFKFFVENGHTLIIKVQLKTYHKTLLTLIEPRTHPWRLIRLIQPELHASKRQEILPYFLRKPQRISSHAPQLPTVSSPRTALRSK
jgi:nucleoside-triphosphatase THEP1